MTRVQDRALWSVRWRLEKRHEDVAAFLALHGLDREADRFRRESELGCAMAEFFGRYRPYEVIEATGNLLVNAGIQLMEDALIGTAVTAFSNANARIGVGDSTTAAAATQTDLQAATNKLRKAMDATFPSRAGQTLSFKSTFADAEANWAWQEQACFNAASAGTMLNRRVQNLGTKTTGSWSLTLDASIS